MNRHVVYTGHGIAVFDNMALAEEAGFSFYEHSREDEELNVVVRWRYTDHGMAAELAFAKKRKEIHSL